MKIYGDQPTRVKCPVCCADQAHILWNVNSHQAAQHFVLKEKSYESYLELASHIEQLWNQGTCDVVQCDHCGFCFSNPYVAGDEKFYRLAYNHKAGDYPAWRWEFQLTYDALLRFVDPNYNLLEIGAGDGAFVRRIAQDMLPKGNILCTEFSDYGKRKIQEFGVRCLSVDVRDLPAAEQEQRFNVVCMFQVLEHMDRLDALFRSLNLLMKKGGSLFIAVPNPGRIEFDELNGALLDMPPNHIGRWNRMCFEEIGAKHGFKIMDFRVEISSYMSMAKQFIIYRFLQKSQKSGSFENRISRIANRRLLRMMQLIGVAVNSISAMPVLTRMDSTLGTSEWVHMVRVKTETASDKC